MLNLDPATLISRIIILITAFSVHEFAHAWTADQFGDQTPRMNGRLTLNPAAHLDPMGSLMLIVAGFGWAKPVPVNPLRVKAKLPCGSDVGFPGGPFIEFPDGDSGSCAFPHRFGFLECGDFSFL